MKLPITVIVATRNEAPNIEKCLKALACVQRILVVDSNSSDGTPEIASRLGAEVVHYSHNSGSVKKRQWAMQSLQIDTPWTMLIDADEVVPDDLWNEISTAVASPNAARGYIIEKGFWFLGKKFRYGGFSHTAVLLFQTGAARFETLGCHVDSRLDMEVHERLIVDGSIERLQTPLIHNDFKGLTAYIDRHNAYSTWEAAVRRQFLTKGNWGSDAIRPRLFGNSQERRRFLKQIACRIPLEHWAWFFYHYLFRLGFLEGTAGLIACRMRAQYILNVRAKMAERDMASSNADRLSVAASSAPNG